MTAVHELKLSSVIFREVTTGKLGFLICEAGPPYQLHDVVRLHELGSDGEPTGASCYVQVTFLVGDPAVGLREGFVALSIKVKMLSDSLNIDQIMGQKT